MLDGTGKRLRMQREQLFLDARLWRENAVLRPAIYPPVAGIVSQYDAPTLKSQSSGGVLRGVRQHFPGPCRATASGRRYWG